MRYMLNDWTSKLLKWLRLGKRVFLDLGDKWIGIDEARAIEIRRKLDPRLPINVLAGMANVVPYNTETTQISTPNWPHGKDCFFLELEGCWNEMPPMDVRVLSAEGEVRGHGFRRLGKPEQITALEFVREYWPAIAD